MRADGFTADIRGDYPSLVPTPAEDVFNALLEAFEDTFDAHLTERERGELWNLSINLWAGNFRMALPPHIVLMRGSLDLGLRHPRGN